MRKFERRLGVSSGRVTPLIVLILTALSAIGPLATDMYIPAFPVATKDLGTTPAGMQLTLTSFFVGMGAGQIVAGPFSDRFGRRTPLLIGIVLCFIGSVCCALAVGIDFMLAARLLQGFGGGVGMVLGRAVLIDIAKGPELFRTLNIMQGIGGVAPIVAPLLGGAILLFATWRESFWFISAISFLSLIAVLFKIPETHPRNLRQSGGFKMLTINAASLFKRRRFTAYLFLNMFSAFCLMAYVSASSFVTQNMFGFAPFEYSLTFAVNSFGLMSMSFLSARLAGTVKPRRLVKIGLSISSTGALALLIGVLFLNTPVYIVLPGFFLIVMAQGFIFGNGGALASQEALDMTGTASALLGLGFSFAAALAAPLVGLAGNNSALPMALVMAAGALLAWSFYYLAGRAKPTLA